MMYLGCYETFLHSLNVYVCWKCVSKWPRTLPLFERRRNYTDSAKRTGHYTLIFNALVKIREDDKGHGNLKENVPQDGNNAVPV